MTEFNFPDNAFVLSVFFSFAILDSSPSLSDVCLDGSGVIFSVV